MKQSISALAIALSISAPAYGLDLLEAYRLALGNDPLVLQTEAKRNAALKNKPIGLAKLLPSLVVNGDLSQLRTDTRQSPIFSQANTDIAYWQGNFQVRLTQPVFHYDSWVTYWQADHKIAQAQATLEAEYQNLAVRVAKAYFDILFAEDTLEITSLNLKSLDLQLGQVQERLAEGFATVMDRDEVQAQHDRVAADLILADQKLNDAKEALREIVGSVDLSLAKIPSQLPLSRPEPADIDIWRNTAQQSNLNIMAAKSAAEIAKENIDLYFAGHLPTLDVVGRHQISGNNRPPTPLDFEESSVGLYVTVPIYSGGGVDAQVEQARDLYEQSLHEVDRQRRTAERQVKDAFRGVLSAISRTGALQTALKSAQGALEAAEMGLRVGNRTVVDVLLEQTKFFQIRTDLAKSRYDFLTNGLLLKQAAGTLVQRDIEAVNGLIHTARTTDPAALAAEPTGMTKATAAQTLASSHGGEVPPIRTRNRTW